MIKFLVRFITNVVGEDRLFYHVSSGINRRMVNLKDYGYLHDTGWIRSLKTQTSIDKDGNPIPWLTYPILDFIEPKLSKNLKIFEYGAGNSTLYFSQRVQEVHSVESNLHWYEKIKNECNTNTFIYYESDKSLRLYSEKPASIGKKFDIFLVDGLYRKECLWFCKDFLSAEGIIIADDTNQYDYGTVLDDLMSLGFKRIDFWGLSSLVTAKKASTILYRANNFLGI